MQRAATGSPMRANPNKIVAVLIWIGAVYTTGLCLQTLNPNLAGSELWLWAAAVQAVLTVLESPFWSGQRKDVNGVAVLIDTGINAGGLWPLLRNLDQTPTWGMITDMTGYAAYVSPYIAFVLALGLGFILAKAPESAWKS